EVERSADALAKSERESAWREMAKQVAHEIKNPLTPMKLRIQHLQRAWDDGAEDFDKRLKDTSHSLVEQIDTLTTIANEFSNFAQMPKAKREICDLVQIMKTTTELFS
ncbi:MAG: histidine kinase dimerization/phospho-acceptor domain-containing protein, partial [Flavobacteriales bacterium]